MSLPELFFIAAGLSMDAFAASVCKGLSIKKIKKRQILVIGLYFGGFQALMPFIGYMLGIRFQNAITEYDHWIAFLLLSVTGTSMIKEATKKEEETCNDSMAPLDMILLAMATSIDAMAMGVTFVFLQVRILPAISIIGTVTFLLSMAGAKAGALFGTRYKSRAEFSGGMILILMGIKILLEDLF